MLTEAIQEEPTDYGPPDYDGLWKKEVTKIFYEGSGQLMHMDKEELSPTFRRVFKVIKERELEKAEKKELNKE